MAVIQRRSTATVTVSTTVVLAVILVIVIIIVFVFLYRKNLGPFRRSPSPAITLPESPRAPRPWREAQNQPMRSDQHKNPHRNYGQPGAANSKTPAQGIPMSEPVRPLPPTPSKLPPVRKATPVNTNAALYTPPRTYASLSGTTAATRTRSASNTPSPPPQQSHSTVKRTTTSNSPLRNPNSHKTLRNLFSSSTTPPPISTFNPRPLRSPISERDILPPRPAHQDHDHPALRHPASSPALPQTKSPDIPPSLLQPLTLPLTSDTTDLSTDIAHPNEQSHLGYKNQTNNNQTSFPPTHSQTNLRLPSSSRPLVNSTYANFLTSRIQNSTSPLNLGAHQNSAALAALLVGSEAGTTDAGTTDAGTVEGRTPELGSQKKRDDAATSTTTSTRTGTTATPLTSPTSTTDDAIRNRQGGRWYGSSRGRGEHRRLHSDRHSGEIEERYRRFKVTGGFSDEGEGKEVDDDPVGRPWGRFDSNIDMGREREGEMGREEGDDGGGGIGPLRLGKNRM
ncbi:hypothetical protein JMJ35_007497 [Cladonia borealis]|uniref:Uncharacterized protein n=1 Tax=Cladonia borealis TaxID=184061 RepID=A0AA39UZM6_9LECA|nr:hypothetical protein JMJ35_007497 [Cladonia borealis]